MKLSTILFTVILVVTGMAFIGNADDHTSTQFAYKQDTVPTATKMQMKKEVESDSIGAEYPGRLPEWQRFLNKNLRCPVDSSGEAIQGKVVVEFIID